MRKLRGTTTQIGTAHSSAAILCNAPHRIFYLQAPAPCKPAGAAGPQHTTFGAAPRQQPLAKAPAQRIQLHHSNTHTPRSKLQSVPPHLAGQQAQAGELLLALWRRQSARQQLEQLLEQVLLHVAVGQA